MKYSLDNFKSKLSGVKWRIFDLKNLSRLLVASLIIFALPTSYVGIRAANNGVSMQEVLADPMSVFSSRSPGVRQVGNLTKTKAAYARISPSTSAFEEFGTGDPAPAYEGFLSSPGSAISEPPLEVPAAFGEMPLGDLVQPNTGFGPQSFGGGAGGPIGQIIPPIGTFPVPQVPPPGPGTEVPEPGTWLMMIAGFFAIGSMLRRRNNQLAKAGTGSFKAPEADKSI